ncbi:hypothetical protein L3D_01220 [Enterococcus faecalis]|nr:hypothetical protein L3D_01220 [Enterococcus faecalis]
MKTSNIPVIKREVNKSVSKAAKNASISIFSLSFVLNIPIIKKGINAKMTRKVLKTCKFIISTTGKDNNTG